VKIGPTAIPAFWRENYHGCERFIFRELIETATRETGLFLHNHFNFRELAIQEIKKYQRTVFIREALALVRHLDPNRVGRHTRPGIRAQLLNVKTHELVMDFIVEQADRSTHVLNAVSPAFTSAFSFAGHIVAESLPYLHGV
jgi:L-2-hydroxyglutarate oxidase LhgO